MELHLTPAATLRLREGIDALIWDTVVNSSIEGEKDVLERVVKDTASEAVSTILVRLATRGINHCRQAGTNIVSDEIRDQLNNAS